MFSWVLFLNRLLFLKFCSCNLWAEMIAEVGSGSEGINCHIYFVTRLLLVAQSSSTSKRAIPNHHFLRLNLSHTRRCLRLFSHVLWYFLWSIVAWLWIIIQCLSFLAFLWKTFSQHFFSPLRNQQAFNDFYNSEHSRLLKMWKEVVAVKRLFRDMSAATKMDLSSIRCEIVGSKREVAGACSGVMVQTKNAIKMDVNRNILII